MARRPESRYDPPVGHARGEVSGGSKHRKVEVGSAGAGNRIRPGGARVRAADRYADTHEHADADGCALADEYADEHPDADGHAHADEYADGHGDAD
jgi:hypothetical protein